MRGNFDDIISESMRPSMYDTLKKHEELMTPPPANRPKVRMEKGKGEIDYPPTRKYDYVPHDAPQNNPLQELMQQLWNKGAKKRKTPVEQMPPNRKFRQIGD